MKREVSIWFKFGIFAIFIVLDWYIFQAIKTTFSESKSTTQKFVYTIYFALSLIPYLALFIVFTINYTEWHGFSKVIIIGFAQAIFIGKLFIIPFLLIDDIIRFFRCISIYFSNNNNGNEIQHGITRLQFLSKSALFAGSSLFVGLVYGITRGAYQYKKRKIKLAIQNLPDEWKNLKIVQFSDLHIGSFANSYPIQKIVDLINAEEPDIIFFTGDLVNYKVDEAIPYKNILQQLKAKIAIYSILGNHDYGTYLPWNSVQEHQQSFQQLLNFKKILVGIC